MSYEKFCFFFVSLLLPRVFAVADYCQSKLCDDGSKHIACNNPGNFQLSCELPSIISINEYYKNLILNQHNLLRNKIAEGFEHFPTAKRMATMLWDDELAKFAELNVKQCEFRHDECRNTHNFSNVGQNIAITKWRIYGTTVSEVIQEQIEGWFNEYVNCPLYIINKFNCLKGPDFRQFTTMVQDKATHIGCSILRSFSSSNFTQQIMVCNYAFSNTVHVPVYEQGKNASECLTGTDNIYTSLCSVREQYDLKY